MPCLPTVITTIKGRHIYTVGRKDQCLYGYAMPNKICPDCTKSVHVRVRQCECGFVFPKKEKKKSRREINPADVQYTFNGWKKVPARTRKAKCGTCSRKMKGGMLGWHSSYDDGEKYWWCDNCLKDFKDEEYNKLSKKCGQA